MRKVRRGCDDGGRPWVDVVVMVVGLLVLLAGYVLLPIWYRTVDFTDSGLFLPPRG